MGNRPSLRMKIPLCHHLMETVRKPDCYWLALIFTEILIFSVTFQGYFFGDSVGQLSARPKTLPEVWTYFTTVTGWYRPMVQVVLANVLFYLFKNNFAAYHALNLTL